MKLLTGVIIAAVFTIVTVMVIHSARADTLIPKDTFSRYEIDADVMDHEGGKVIEQRTYTPHEGNTFLFDTLDACKSYMQNDTGYKASLKALYFVLTPLLKEYPDAVVVFSCNRIGDSV